MHLHRLCVVLAAIFASGLARSAAGEDAATAPAAQAMESWLQEIDEGRYAESWEAASGKFQEALTSAQWVAALNSARKPLGACLERKLASALPQQSLPNPQGGVLKGEFVVAQFKTSFANLARAMETVTFEKAADGQWKASGYFVRPDA